MRVVLSIALVTCAFGAYAQNPVINSVVPVATYPGNKVLISGSGFSTNPAQLKVSFDHVAGTITASTTLSIEVTMPPQARLSNVEVLHLVSGLSAKSTLKAVPTFGGGDFDNTLVGAPLSFAGAIGEELFDVCSCDLDGDGLPDLASTKGGPTGGTGTANTLLMLRNTSAIGTISFTQSTASVPAPTANLACNDLDGNGKPDIVVTRGGATRNEIFVLRNTSTSPTISFVASATLVMDVGHFAFRPLIRDLNADGKPEIIVTNAFDDPGSSDNSIYVYVNQSTVGTISFAAPQKFTVTGSNTSYGLDVQDLDGDSKPDIIVNPFSGANLYILRNTSIGAVSFAPSQMIPLLGSTLIEVTTADLNEDGKLDLATTSSFDNRVIVLLNQSTTGSVSFGAGTNLSLPASSSPWGINATDADGDGDVDLLVGGIGAGSTGLTLFKSNGVNNALAFTPVVITTTRRNRNVRVGDYDGDAKPDFAFTTGTGNTLDIVRNQNCYIPTILNSTPLTICAGQTIRLNAAPGFGITLYDWEESGTSVSPGANAFYDVTTAGTYTVTATSESGTCVKTSNTIVITNGSGTLPSDPVISSNSPLCSGIGATLQLNGPTVAGVNYIWMGPNGFTSSVEDPQITNVTSAHAGVYSLQLSNGTCFSNTATTLVEVANLAGFSVSSSVPSNTICQGSNLTLSVASQSGYTYQWRKDGVDIGGQTALSLLVTLEGAYTVRVTNTALSCSLTTSPAVSVTVLTAPSAAFTVNPAGCVDELLTFTDQSAKDSRATAAYAWDFGDAGTSTSASPAHAYTSANSFNPSLTLSYTGVSGCSSSVSQSVAIAALPAVVIDPAAPTIAMGESVQLTATGATSYVWSPPDGLSSTIIGNPLASPATTTTYTVTGTENGCDGTATVTVTVTGATGSLDIPNVFTPNGDSFNDNWIVPLIEGGCAVSVYASSGQKVWNDILPSDGWDGLVGGSPAPSGTYYYVITCPTAGIVNGHFLLAR